MRNTRGDP